MANRELHQAATASVCLISWVDDPMRRQLS